MTSAALLVALLFVVAPAAPAYAQLGGIMNKAQKVKGSADKVNDLRIDDKEERQLGENVSAKLREKYGVYQDPVATKYVTLLGTLLAQASSRPNLDWKFIVLDTDAVNAFAAPGGFIHVTKGLLGLARNESELAGALGHEITHVTAKHTVNYLQQQKGIAMGADAAGKNGSREYLLSKFSERAYHILLDGEFSRDDEQEADKIGVQLASKLGFAPAGLAEVLKKLEARNTGREEKNGLFASHPATKARIAAIEKQVTDEKLAGTAKGEARYAKNITFAVKPVGDIAMAVGGSAGLSGDSKSAPPPKTEEKKKGGLLGKVGLTSGTEAKNTQTVASAGSRGIGNPDRDATGGTNPALVNVKVSPAELDTFKKGIA